MDSAEQYRLTGTPNALGLEFSYSLFNLGRRLGELERWGEAVQAFEEQMQAVEWSLRNAAQSLTGS